MVSVVSGQQIGLLGGPIFLLYKILGVYRLSQLGGGGIPAGHDPVFWLEGNDADLSEIGFFHGLDSRGEIKKYRWEPRQLRGQPIGNYRVDDDLHRLYGEFFAALPPTGHTEAVRDLVYHSYRIGDTLLEANRNFFSALFREFEESHPGKKMRWFSPDEEGFRKFSQPFLQEELQHTPEGEQSPVFALIAGRREALFKKQGFVTRGGKRVAPEQVLLLPSVWNRSILQDAYLRAAAYVAGPAEVKYLQDLLPRYREKTVLPARVIPRMSAVVGDFDQAASAERLGFTLEEVATTDYLELIHRLQENDPQLKKNLRQLRRELWAAKEERVGREHLGREEERELYVKMKHGLGETRRAFRERRAEEIARLRELVSWVHPTIPGGKAFPQERFHNVVTFLNRYGREAIPAIYREYGFEKKTLRLRHRPSV